MVALTETRESRAVDLLREERAVEVEEAMASTYGGGMTKNGAPKRFSKDFSENLRNALRYECDSTEGTDVRRTSVLAFEPLFA